MYTPNFRNLWITDCRNVTVQRSIVAHPNPSPFVGSLFNLVLTNDSIPSQPGAPDGATVAYSLFATAQVLAATSMCRTEFIGNIGYGFAETGFAFSGEYSDYDGCGVDFSGLYMLRSTSGNLENTPLKLKHNFTEVKIFINKAIDVFGETCIHFIHYLNLYLIYFYLNLNTYLSII